MRKVNVGNDWHFLSVYIQNFSGYDRLKVLDANNKKMLVYLGGGLKYFRELKVMWVLINVLQKLQRKREPKKDLTIP